MNSFSAFLMLLLTIWILPLLVCLNVRPHVRTMYNERFSPKKPNLALTTSVVQVVAINQIQGDRINMLQGRHRWLFCLTMPLISLIIFYCYYCYSLFSFCFYRKCKHKYYLARVNSVVCCCIQRNKQLEWQEERE